MGRSHVMAKTLSDLFEKDFMQMTRRIYEAEPEPSSPIYSNKVQRHSVVPRSRQRQRQRLAKGKNAKKVKGKNVPGKSGHRNDVNEEYMKMKNQMNALQNRVDQMKEQMLAMGLKLPSSDMAPPMSVEEKKALSQEINQFTGERLEQIIKIMQESMQIDTMGSDYELEIDLDTIPNETLRRLQGYVRKCNAAGHSGERSRHMNDLNSHMTTGNIDIDSGRGEEESGDGVDDSLDHDFF